MAVPFSRTISDFGLQISPSKSPFRFYEPVINIPRSQLVCMSSQVLCSRGAADASEKSKRQVRCLLQLPDRNPTVRCEEHRLPET